MNGSNRQYNLGFVDEEVEEGSPDDAKFTKLTIFQPHRNIVSIEADEHEDIFNDDDWPRACNVIRETASLKCIEYEPSRKSDKAARYLAMLFDKGNHFDIPLQSVSINHVPLDRTIFGGVIDRFVTGPTPAKIKLTKAKLTDGSVQLLVDAMNSGLRVSHLNLSRNNIGDNGIALLVSARNLNHLLELNLSENTFTRRGLANVGRLMEREETAIEKLELTPGRYSLGSSFHSYWSKGCVETMLRSLSNNRQLKLKTIRLGNRFDWFDDSARIDNSEKGGVYDSLAEKVEALVCNPSSFAAFCESNHTFQQLCQHVTQLKARSPALERALAINLRSGLTGNQKLRCKLRLIYLVGDFDTQPFNDMDTVYMPNILELATMCEERCDGREGRFKKGTYVLARNGHLGSIYRLIRNCHISALFSYPSSQGEMESLMARNAELESRVEKLQAEIEQLRSRSGQARKRPKTK